MQLFGRRRSAGAIAEREQLPLARDHDQAGTCAECPLPCVCRRAGVRPCGACDPAACQATTPGPRWTQRR